MQGLFRIIPKIVSLNAISTYGIVLDKNIQDVVISWSKREKHGNIIKNKTML